jgi:hypothetical protein
MNKILITICSIAMILIGTHCNSYAISRLQKQPAALANLTAPSDAYPILPTENRSIHLSFFKRMKYRLVNKLMDNHRYYHGSKKPGDLSITAFCLSMGAIATVLIGLVLFNASYGALLLSFVIGGGLALAGGIIGIIALAKRQRLKGLAIAAIIISLI